MTQPMIEQLTPQQKALIPVYRDKWRNIALSTEPCDSLGDRFASRQKAKVAIKNAYSLIELSEPDIIFYDSLYAIGKDCNLIIDESIYQTDYTARKAFANHLSSSIIWTIIEKILRQLSNEIQKELLKNFSSVFKDELERSFQMLADSPFIPHLHEREYLQYVKLNKLFFDGYEVIIYPDRWINSASICDFCIKVLNCEYPPKEWEVLQAIVENCGCIFPFEKLVIVCDRPCIFSLDSRNRLHAEGKPAIAFADGYSLYAYHGVWLPEKYGKIHPIEWRSEWLLEEDNAELRRVLIQAIGYDRIILYLQTTELDTFQEYRLLKIDKNIDEEPIYLLKMNCPSTGNIHILRVPPDMRTAREAIAWVNWGIAPEYFSVQT